MAGEGDASPPGSAPGCRLYTVVNRLLIIIETLGRTAAACKITLFVLNYQIASLPVAED